MSQFEALQKSFHLNIMRLMSERLRPADFPTLDRRLENLATKYGSEEEDRLIRGKGLACLATLGVSKEGRTVVNAFGVLRDIAAVQPPDAALRLRDVVPTVTAVVCSAKHLAQERGIDAHMELYVAHAHLENVMAMVEVNGGPQAEGIAHEDIDMLAILLCNLKTALGMENPSNLYSILQ